ncbi:MAG: hypothetical protein HXY38_11050 [Chloroflexi bacterium]|nr:hypothetical protein [Chloroflexota bacterium]
MKLQNILFWICLIVSTLFGIITIGYGVDLLLAGQDCGSFADMGCAFGIMFSFVFIPYGLVVLVFAGLTTLPFRAARLTGAIFSTLIGFGNVSMCCLTLSWTAGADISSLTTGEMMFFLLPLTLFIGGMALMGLGVLGYQRSRQ